MMIRFPKAAGFLAALLCLLLSSCARPTPVVPTPTTALPTPAATATAGIPHAPEIKFALVGNVTDANVWALFDATGYSYNNYAVRSSYWPRLYHLRIPDGTFEPQAAAGMPSSVQQEGPFFTATVPLRSDLKWTDGSPFTADDVAFTVNTALSFQLGFDWRAFDDPAYLDHAEAVDAHTVKFFFKKAPNVAVWHYGALQGPVVQKAYWSPKIAASAALLPTAADLNQIDSITAQVVSLQRSINALMAESVTATGDPARQIQSQLQNQQRNLDGFQNDLTKAHVLVDGTLDAARRSLDALDASGEPTLGTWVPAGASENTWTNSANPAHPFASPNFDRAVYVVYPDERSAQQAYIQGEVNAVLQQEGFSVPAVNREMGPWVSNANSTIDFLVINPGTPELADPVLRRAFFCAIRPSMAKVIIGNPPASLLPTGDKAWFDPQSTVTCGSDASVPPMQHAINLIKDAGYTWQKEPSIQDAGMGLAPPNATPLPTVQFLAPDAKMDFFAGEAAPYVQEALQHLGLTVNILTDSPADIRYALFNDHKYDMAIVGWRLSAYPSYLCDWFGDGNPFGYNIPQVRADCAALSTTTDLDQARQLFFDIQSVLSQDPPFIPLFSGVTYDSTRGIVYPFNNVLNGLSGVYGAPELAIPAP